MSGDAVETTTPAVFVRGGTSKGLVFRARDLPEDRADWAPIFLSAMGSPDPYGRQLNGMGGGLSSLSKVCVIAPSVRPGIDVEYTFAQVQIAAADVNYSGNCGNMSSAIGPLAVDEGILSEVPDGRADVRMLNLNTGKTIVAHFNVADGRSVIDSSAEMEGVIGPSTRVELEFLDPAGAATGRLLPSGQVKDLLRLEDGSSAEVSLVDAANPCVFVLATELGCTGLEGPEELEQLPGVLRRLQQIREAASVAMRISASLEAARANPTTPFIAMVSGPAAFTGLDGREHRSTEMSFTVRFLSNGQPHRAVPVTGALCAVAAAHIPGTVVAQAVSPAGTGSQGSSMRIAHPSGCTEVAAVAEFGAAGVTIVSSSLFRTTRRLFDGVVHHTVPDVRGSRDLHVERRPARADAGNLIFIHGSMDTGGSFRALAERFPEWNTITYDRRGYGRSLATSASDAGPASVPDVAAHVADVEDLLSGTNNVLVGHSFGGDLALIAAGRDPRVSAVVAYEAPLSWLPAWPRPPLPARLDDPADVTANAEAFLRRAMGDEKWERLDASKRRSILGWAPAWAAELKELTDGEWPFDPTSLAVPVLILGGSDSERRHHEGSALWRTALPHADFAEIAHAGHALRADSAADVAAPISAFFARYRLSGPAM